jgi:undecaprenyl-diphosphatase
MEPWLEALILGIVQGLTEFLPVSSSGHLEIAKFLLGYDAVPEESLLLTVTTHAATALATLWIFRKDVWVLFKGVFKGPYDPSWGFTIRIIISMIPAVLIGLLWEDNIEELFNNAIPLVSIMLLITGALLWFADTRNAGDRKITILESFIIGLAQAFAILPGISRSGATISAALILKNDRELTARFSFLMVVPLILGKMIMELSDGELSSSSDGNLNLIIAFIAAFVSGALACKWMISIVKRAKLKFFGWYCLAVGLIFLIWSSLV